MFRIIRDEIDSFIEDCKEKEYIVFFKVNMTNGRYDKKLFTKKQLLQFMKENGAKGITVFKIKDEIKINEIFEVED